eukprot:scaffold10246_cov101-Isochrysis_galbana.AAC.2
MEKSNSAPPPVPYPTSNTQASFRAARLAAFCTPRCEHNSLKAEEEGARETPGARQSTSKKLASGVQHTVATRPCPCELRIGSTVHGDSRHIHERYGGASDAGGRRVPLPGVSPNKNTPIAGARDGGSAANMLGIDATTRVSRLAGARHGVEEEVELPQLRQRPALDGCGQRLCPGVADLVLLKLEDGERPQCPRGDERRRQQHNAVVRQRVAPEQQPAQSGHRTLAQAAG